MAADGVVFAEVGRDVSDMLGFRQQGVWIVVGAFLAAVWTVVGYLSWETDSWIPMLAAAVLSCSVVVIVRAHGDPLPGLPTLVALLTGPLVSALALLQTPADLAPSVLLMWIHGGPTAVYCFTAVRGRFPAVFAGVAAMAVVFGFWGQATGQTFMDGVSRMIIDAAPLTMSMLFALVLRPTASSVFLLRQQTLERVAQTSADIAADEERTQQLDILNTLARPLLKRIASGEELSDAERTECALLEAHLRDRLRAPLMSELKLDRLAYEARLRGVDVTFIDDSHLDDDPAAVALDDRVTSALAALCADVLANTESGKVFVRVATPGRSIAASVLLRDGDENVRYELDHSGDVTVFH
ncbi:hypothetical protein [Gordonia sp. (in: high G+C Gram-positive bacteria)]|jgi:hypothetical protein|uniref:hypothetical protein n=2 Tax=Gordonia sp. (in: high G+C Gram-positive bacteria) TaxID=84139 RepID=UPI00261B312D|nr:hypothetical protein [Gordonia sp. (in: high G+C Gram-positive bacteria)]HMS73934.1 hypothetical protein [Gordonia sp. (in: high G+C Gram-positive bacteria)]HQV18816.1 hypothetical protein [Gordonia sp. (in: high G+C Gram-positive bacteria)]